MNRTVEFLSRFCREHRLEKKTLVCPSHQIGQELGRSLAAEAGGWTNLHIATLPLLAQGVVGVELSRSGTKIASGQEIFFLVETIFRRLRDERRLDYFAPAEATTGVVRALAHSISALRMAGLKSSDLKPADFVDERKGREIALLLQLYENKLSERNQVDLPGLYELALGKIRYGRKPGRERREPNAEREFFLVLRDRPLEDLERAFLEELAGRDLVLVPQDPVYGLVRPGRIWDGATESPAPHEPPPPDRFSSNIERLPWLFATAKAPPPVPDDSIEIFSAVGPTNECREILRRVLSRGVALDEVEIIHPPNSAVPAILYSLTGKSGLPATFAEGIPIAFTWPGKAFRGLADWLENDYLVSDLCALIEADALRLPEGNEGNGGVTLMPLKASRYLKNAMIGWGRERYVGRLETLIRDAEENARAAESEGEFERSERFRQTAREVGCLVMLVKEILELFPVESEDGTVDFAALCRGASSFVGKFARISGELDAEARRLLESRLDEAASSRSGSSGATPLRRQVAFEWLREIASGLNVGASGPAPGHLHCSSWKTGGFSGRRETFVVGLDQATFPGTGIQDPILLDEERRRISKKLRTSDESLRENLWLLAGMLSGLRGRVTLSYSDYDIIEEREAFPSSLILQAARLKEGRPELNYSDLEKLVPRVRGFLPEVEEAAVKERGRGSPEAEGAWPEIRGTKRGGARLPREPRALDEMDWWLGKLAPGGVLRDGMEAVKMNFDLLGRGIFALERRGRPKVGEFEGKIDVRPEEISPLRNREIPISASRLETLAKCPFAYLMRYVLDVRPPEELELDQSQWLNPLLRGALLHEIFADFMRELKKARRKREAGRAAGPGRGKESFVRVREHGPLLRKITGELIDRYKEEIPPPSAAVFEQEKREIEEAVDVFLKMEEERTKTCEPILFEVAFGTEKSRPAQGEPRQKGKEDRAANEEDAALETVVLELGRNRWLSIAGRIDRIDRLDDGRFRVIDYKTGSFKIYDDVEMFGKGRVLQHALYAVAAEQILKKLGIDEQPVVAESGYDFPTRRGEGHWVQPGFDRAALNRLVLELIGVIERGHFVVNPGLGDMDCEGFCDYAPICGGSAALERAKEKKERNPDVFAIFDRLKDYE